jgi:hypothetical protein
MASSAELSAARWRKSSFSGGDTNSECVEVALVGEATAMRDSKNRAGEVLLLPSTAWTSLLTHL